jgi:site-specific DNA-methyltransferase (adenine-specific)
MTEYSLACRDAVEFLGSLAPESVDLMITDPPYESLEKYRKIGTTTRLKKKWFDIFPNERFPSLFEQIYRVLKKNSHFYMFCDAETMFIVKPLAEEAGFKFWKPLVWDKVNIGMGYHYRSRYEFILFFEKGKKRLKHLGVSDILTQKRVLGGYPTEKPPEISEILVKQSSLPNDVVCDPFMGSGSVGVATLKNDRKFLGCDTNERSVTLTYRRLRSI